MADLSKLRLNGTDYNVKDASAPLRKFTNYSKTGNLPITSDDTTQAAIGKLEKALDDKINTSAKGTASGVAELDANGKVPSSQLPSYVDDVLEYDAKASFPVTGEAGKIYVDKNTNKTYRWSGSAYVEISESLALGETSSTAYRGDRGKTAYDHSQTSGNPHGTTGAGVNLTGYSKGSDKSAVAATDTINAAIAKHENRINANQTNILSVTSQNPISVYSLDSKSMTGAGYLVDENTPVKMPKGNYNIAYTSDKAISMTLVVSNGNTEIHRESMTCAIGANSFNFTTTTNGDNIRAYVSESCEIDNLCIVPKVYRDCGYTDYVSNTLPNTAITPELIELCDSGAKNKLQDRHTGSNTIAGITFTHNSDDSITLNGTATSRFNYDIFSNTSGTTQFNGMVVSGSIPSSGSDTAVSIMVDTPSNVEIGRSTGGNSFIIPNGSNVGYIRLRFITNEKVTNKTIYPMVCTQAAWNVSKKYVPYRPNWDLVCKNVNDLQGANSFLGLKIVYANAYSESHTHSYLAAFADTASISGSGSCMTYLIMIVTWGTSPSQSMYALSISGGNLNYSTLTKVFGADANVTYDNTTHKIQVVSTGRVTIYALR